MDNMQLEIGSIYEVTRPIAGLQGLEITDIVAGTLLRVVCQGEEDDDIFFTTESCYGNVDIFPEDLGSVQKIV